MKEYIIIPLKDYNEMKLKQHTSFPTNSLNHQSPYLNTSTTQSTPVSDLQSSIPPSSLPSEIRLDIMNDILNKQIPKQEKDELKKDITSFTNFLPLHLRTSGRLLMENIMKIKDVTMDDFGIIYAKDIDSNIRGEDLLRILLVKNSSIKGSEPMIAYIINHIPLHFIRNPKVLRFKEEQSGGKKKKKQHSIKWVHL